MSRILIVEDEESIAELERDYLELSGFEVEIEGKLQIVTLQLRNALFIFYDQYSTH